MQAYLRLQAYPEVKSVLQQLRHAGLETAILSNGSPAMLVAAVEGAGIADLLDHNLSVESVGIYKPDPRVYELAVKSLGIEAGAVSFMSSNAWDAAGAAHFGFRVAWVNRFGQRPERLPAKPDVEIGTLSELPGLLGL